MKTPLQELLQYESDLTNMFDSDVRVAGAILEYIRTNKKDMLEKEKEVIINAVKYGCSDWGSAKDAEEYYNETFKTKER